jgi:hypothetical protein
MILKLTKSYLKNKERGKLSSHEYLTNNTLYYGGF